MFIIFMCFDKEILRTNKRDFGRLNSCDSISLDGEKYEIKSRHLSFITNENDEVVLDSILYDICPNLKRK